MIYQNFIAQRPKSDVIFHRAFIQLKSRCKCTAVFKAVLSCALLAVIIINIMKNDQSINIVQVIVGCFILSMFGLTIKLYQIKVIYSDNILFLALADAKGHTTGEQFTRNFTRIEDCVNSNVFIANTNLNEADLDEITKKTYLNAAVRSISIQLSVIYRGVASAQRLNSVLALASIVYSIYALTDPNINLMNTITLAVYTSLVGLAQYIVLIALIILCLVPLLCLIFAFYYCCCKRNAGSINLPEKNASLQDILNVEGDCSICYQSIAENQKVYVLPCSEKHVFHKGCLDKWVNIKQTCPICRAQIPMGSRSGPVLVVQQ